VLFVSHDVTAVRSLCSRAIYLEHGSVKMIGSAPEVAESYIRTMREEMNAEQQRFAREPWSAGAKFAAALPQGARTDSASFKRSAAFELRSSMSSYGSGGARVTYAEVLGTADGPKRHFAFDEEVTIVICFESYRSAELLCSYYVLDAKRNNILGSEQDVCAKAGGLYTVTYRTRLPLREGNYSLQIELSEPIVYDESGAYLDVIDDSIVFQVARKARGRIWAGVCLPNSTQVVEEVNSGAQQQSLEGALQGASVIHG
jgi:lipopolysaccharide transport system ATP-binding protein